MRADPARKTLSWTRAQAVSITLNFEQATDVPRTSAMLPTAASDSGPLISLWVKRPTGKSMAQVVAQHDQGQLQPAGDIGEKNEPNARDSQFQPGAVGFAESAALGGASEIYDQPS